MSFTYFLATRARLLLPDPLVLFHRFGGDGRGRFRRVGLLNVSCGSGDGSPSLATTDADSETSDQYQHQGQ